MTATYTPEMHAARVAEVLPRMTRPVMNMLARHEGNVEAAANEADAWYYRGVLTAAEHEAMLIHFLAVV